MKRISKIILMAGLIIQGCWAMEADTAGNRLIVRNNARGWTGFWRIQIKWNVRTPRGAQTFEQILEPNDSLLLGPISQVSYFEFAAYGKVMGKTSPKNKEVSRVMLQGWQADSKAGEDIIASITTDASGAFFEVKALYKMRAPGASLQVAPFTGKLLDSYPTVRKRILEKETEAKLAQITPEQIDALVKQLQEAGFIQPRHFLGLPEKVADKNIISNVYALKHAGFEDLKNQRPNEVDLINKIQDYLERAYQQLMR